MALSKKRAILFAVILTVSSCGESGEFPDTISINVNAGGRAISTIAAVIAKDQGLFEKHGLDVQLIMDLYSAYAAPVLLALSKPAKTAPISMVF
jgi:ABC-type nitrate/sulfonate/bicarbonate transport system substrate-binding protein